ncbi:MAG: DEAD/DEAH box helicase, partial [Candidatus Xenobia bacterium]
NPGLLGSHESFSRRFGADGRSIPAQRLARLRGVLQPFVLRRLKTDPTIIRDLPEKHEMKVYCPLTREQVTLYQATVQDMLDKIDSSRGMQRRGLVLTTILRLKQICDHPTLFLDDRSGLTDRSGKLIRLEEMLTELLAADDCALIFTQFREMGRTLAAHLSERLSAEVLHLHGGVPQKMRDLMVQRFQSEDGPRIFVLSVRAGGLGLNLTRANHVFHFDRWWNPAVENQATDRAFRIGQRRNVMVHKFITQGTLEEAIDRLIESKLQLAETVIGSGEGWLTELSTDQLRGLISLREETFAESDDLEVPLTLSASRLLAPETQESEEPADFAAGSDAAEPDDASSHSSDTVVP